MEHCVTLSKKKLLLGKKTDDKIIIVHEENYVDKGQKENFERERNKIESEKSSLLTLLVFSRAECKNLL